MEFKQRIQQLLSGGRDIDRPADTHYVHIPTGQILNRCTTYLKGGEKFIMPAKWKGASGIGTCVDQMGRDFFVDGPRSLRNNTYEFMTQDAFNQFLTGLDSIKGALGEWTVYADRCFLYSLERGVAGEVDLLLVNYTTEEVIIVDMKTVRSPKYMTPGSEKMKNYKKQLNVYRLMAEEMMGGYPVSKLFVLPIHVTYSPYGTITTTAEVLEWMPIDQEDPTDAINELWQKTHNMTAKEYLLHEIKTTEDNNDWWAELQAL